MDLRAIMQDIFDPETESQLSSQYQLIHPTFHVPDVGLKSQQTKKRKAANDSTPSNPKRPKIEGKSFTAFKQTSAVNIPAKRPAPTIKKITGGIASSKNKKAQVQAKSVPTKIQTPKVHHIFQKITVPTLTTPQVPTIPISQSLPSSSRPVPGGCVWSQTD